MHAYMNYLFGWKFLYIQTNNCIRNKITYRRTEEVTRRQTYNEGVNEYSMR